MIYAQYLCADNTHYKVRAIKVIRNAISIGLKEGKELVEDAISGPVKLRLNPLQYSSLHTHLMEGPDASEQLRDAFIMYDHEYQKAEEGIRDFA
jgi:hypothetical protein